MSGKVLEKIKSVGIRYLLVIVLLVGVILFLVFGNISNLKHRETVLNFGFRDVGFLVTQEWYGRFLEDSSEDRKLFNKISVPFTNSRLIFSLDVEVTAGVDFNEIEYKINNNEIVVKVPKSIVYKYYQVPKSFISYLDDESWFTNIDSVERHKIEDEVVEKGKETALEAGLLEKADENAKKIIEQMIKSKNKDLEIKWEYK